MTPALRERTLLHVSSNPLLKRDITYSLAPIVSVVFGFVRWSCSGMRAAEVKADF